MSSPLPIDTQACEDRDFVEWHGGCPWCAVWVLRVQTPEVERAVAQARAVIAPWLLPRYARQPHVTVTYRGLMSADSIHPRTEFAPPALARDVRALQAAALQPFEVQLAGWGSFSTVPYGAVMPHPALQRAHEALMAHTPYPDWQYVPHITLGHYARVLPVHDVLAQLERAGQALTARVPVHAIWLARYRTDDIAGALSFEGCFDLRTQRYHAAPGALLASPAIKPGSA